MAIFQVNLGYPVFIEAKDDGGGGDNWTTGAMMSLTYTFSLAQDRSQWMAVATTATATRT